MTAVRRYFEGVYFGINYRDSMMLRRTVRRLFRRGSEGIEHRVCRIVKPYAPHSVLDLGCGPGHVLSALAEQHDLERVTGIDLSAPALHLAEKRLANVPSASFRCEDLRSCRALADRHDAVLAIGVFDYCPFDVALLRALLGATNRVAVVTMPRRSRSPRRGLRHVWLRLNGVRLLSYDQDDVAAIVSSASAEFDIHLDFDSQPGDNMWITCVRRDVPAI